MPHLPKDSAPIRKSQPGKSGASRLRPRRFDPAEQRSRVACARVEEQEQRNLVQLLLGELAVGQRAGDLDLDEIGAAQHGCCTQHHQALVADRKRGMSPDIAELMPHALRHEGRVFLTLHQARRAGAVDGLDHLQAIVPLLLGALAHGFSPFTLAVPTTERWVRRVSSTRGSATSRVEPSSCAASRSLIIRARTYSRSFASFFIDYSPWLMWAQSRH